MEDQKTTPQQTPANDGNDQSISEADVVDETKSESESQAEPSKQAEAGTTEDKHKQSQEDNARFARERRQREADAKAKKEAQEKEAYDRGYRKAQLDANKTNPYTGEPIENDHDLEMYLAMKELDDKGKDPLKSFPKYMADKLLEADAKAKADEEAKAAEAERQKAVDEDIAKQKAELAKLHPEVNLSDLSKDKDFMAYAKTRVGRWTYTEIVEGWQAKNATKEAPKQAKPKSTPSSIPGNTKPAKSIKDMTDDEYIAYSKRVHGGF